MFGRTRVSQRPLAVVGVLVVAAAVGGALGTAGADATAPGEPMSFYGEAADADGTPAPAGTVIVAAVDGEEVDRVTVDETGVYAGDSPTDEKLRTHTEAGDTVTFHVGSVDGPQAGETHDIDESGVFELDLTFPAGTFEAEADAPPPGGGGGGGGGSADDSDSADESGSRITVELSLAAESSTAEGGSQGVRSGSVSVAAGANSTIELDLAATDPESADGSGSGGGTDGSASEQGAAIDRIEIDVTEDVEVNLTVRQSTEPPGGDARALVVDDGTQAVSYVQIETDLEDAQMGQARFDFRLSREALQASGTAPADVAMYHYDETGGEWEELPTAVIEETEESVRFRAETDGFSEFAIGFKRARLGIADASIAERDLVPGGSLQVELAVTNSGGASGTFTTELHVDDELVERADVEVAPGSTRTVVLEHEVSEAGTYAVRVNDRSLGEVLVEPGTGDGEDQPSADEGTSEAAGGAGSSTAEPDSPGGILPGGRFVAAIALLVVGGAIGAAAVLLLRHR